MEVDEDANADATGGWQKGIAKVAGCLGGIAGGGVGCGGVCGVGGVGGVSIITFESKVGG